MQLQLDVGHLLAGLILILIGLGITELTARRANKP